jgi:hypothetical protein
VVAERWPEEFSSRVRQWCDNVAPLAVDALVRAGIVPGGEFGRACGIVAEELFVRLALLDYPPTPEPHGGSA